MVGYAFSVQYFKNATIVAYVSLRVKQEYIIIIDSWAMKSWVGDIDSVCHYAHIIKENCT